MNFDKTKQRLKELREQKGISHEALSRILEEQYGVKISGQRLRDYEIADEYHTKYTSTQGMGIKFLRSLAVFYNVTSDYLLGISEIPTPNETIQGINTKIGLSSHAVSKLMVEKDFKESDIADFISFLIESDNIKGLIESIKCKNTFSNTGQCCYMPTEQNIGIYTDKIPMSAIYKIYTEDIFWDIVSHYKITEEAE